MLSIIGQSFLKKSKVIAIVFVVCLVQMAFYSNSGDKLALEEYQKLKFKWHLLKNGIPLNMVPRAVDSKELNEEYYLNEGKGPAQVFNILFPDNRPNDYEYAVLSEYVYSNIKKGEVIKIKLGEEWEWEVIDTRNGKNNYFGAIYKNNKRRQLVLAHIGTQSLGNILEDFQVMVLKLISPQQEEANKYTKEAIELAKNEGFRLSFTGHSLGALLAELSVYWCHNQYWSFDVNAVTFESPGSKDIIDKRLLPNLNNNIDQEMLDIVEYLSYPNLINTWGYHIGTVYQVYPNLGNLGWVHGWYTKQSHNITNTIKYILSSGSVRTTTILMQDWPLRIEINKYFDLSQFVDNKYLLIDQLSIDTNFELYYKAHYVPATAMDDNSQLLLKHFNFWIREFLTDFFQAHKYSLRIAKARKALKEHWEKSNIPHNTIDLISNFRIDNYGKHSRVSIDTNQDIRKWRYKLSLALSQLEIDDMMELFLPVQLKETKVE